MSVPGRGRLLSPFTRRFRLGFALLPGLGGFVIQSIDRSTCDQCVCFFVLCNRHWFNKAPGPDSRGTEMGVTYLPFALAQTLAMPIYPYSSWVPQSA